MGKLIHRWINTIAIAAIIYFLYQVSQSSQEKDVKQCEYLLMEELQKGK